MAHTVRVCASLLLLGCLCASSAYAGELDLRLGKGSGLFEELWQALSEFLSIEKNSAADAEGKPAEPAPPSEEPVPDPSTDLGPGIDPWG